MPDIRVEGADDFQQEVVFGSSAGERMRAEVWEVVRATSLAAVRGIRIRMPVDTGAARARWGSQDANGGVWTERPDELAIVQGAAVEPFEYISRLNEGSSTQAPAGFIDVEVERANDALSGGALEAVVRVWDENP